jgi:biopolymer transport protein ExbB
MRNILTGVFVLGIVFSSFSISKKEMLNTELKQIGELLQSSRDSLEREIATRYSYKQHTVEQQQLDQQDYDRMKEKLERSINDLAKAKEEVLVREQNLIEVKKTASDKEEEWNIVKNSIQEIFQKEAASLSETFPVGREKRQADLEGIRRDFQANKDPMNAWDGFIQYKIDHGAKGRSISMLQEKILPNEGAARMCSVARFGNVFAFCMDTARKTFIIRQTGHLGADKYAIDEILSRQLINFLSDAMPKWTQTGLVSGNVLTDVMQNEQSRMMIAGKQTGGLTEFGRRVKAGGAIMIPLFFLPLWAGWLIFLKVRQFSRRSRNYKTVIETAMGYINRNDLDKAYSYVKSQQGLMARIVEVSLDPNKKRALVEHQVRNLIMQEVPILNRNLNTLAVIAGAAPLVGLLGTISGMITLFAAVTHYGTGDPKFLAGGISEALITALTGLGVAIPTLFVHDGLRNRKDRMIAEIESMSLMVLDKLKPEN